MAQRTFRAQVKGFADLSKKDMRYVATAAIQDVVAAAQSPQVGFDRRTGPPEQGKIPVVSGDLRKSLVSSLAGGAVVEGIESYAAVIPGYELGDSMSFGWTKEYALPVELGRGGKKGAHYVGANAAKFSAFVARRVAEVRK